MYLPNGNPAPGPEIRLQAALVRTLTAYSQSLLDSGAPAPISRGNRKFESISLQSGESTANPVGWPRWNGQCGGGRSPWQAQRCGWRNPCGISGEANPWHNKTVGPPAHLTDLASHSWT